MAEKKKRIISVQKKVSVWSVIGRWETVLLMLFILINVMNISLSANYLHAYNLFTCISTFLTTAFVALAMSYILLLGEIDISVGSAVCLSATVLGISYNATGSAGIAILCAILVGSACGFFNGILVVYFPELPSMIITLGTMVLYRGLSERILGDTSTKGMRDVEWFSKIFDARLGVVPYCFIFFAIMAILFGYVMHKTAFGRRVYAIGSNQEAARYAGIKVGKVKLTAYVVMGLVTSVSAILYCSWMGSVKNDIADGYEMEAICMCVLGGFSTDGGKGNFVGVLISIFIIGMLRYGLGLVNVNAQKIRIIIGMMLIIVVLLPRFKEILSIHKTKD